MNVQIKPELKKFVEDQVKAGRYESTDDAINAAVAALQTTHELSPEEIRELQQELDIGLAEADRGDFVDFTAEDIIADRRSGPEKKRS